MNFRNEAERIAEQAAILEKYPRKPSPPYWHDRPTKADLDRLEGETPVAATPSTEVIDVTDKEWSTALATEGQKFQGALKVLAALPLTRQSVEVAKEMDVEAVEYMRSVASSKGRKLADAAHQLHIFHTGILNRLLAGPEAVRKGCADLFRRFDQQERLKAAQEQREREEAIRRQQEAERAAEVESLKATGKVEEAVALMEEPLPTIVSPPAKEATKIEGVSLVYSAGWGEITDPEKFWRHVAEHPELRGGFAEKPAFWKALGTAHLNRNTGDIALSIPGFKWAVSSSSRHRTNE